MKGRTPTKDEKAFMDRMVQLGCIVCYKLGYEAPATIHHMEGKTRPGAHYKVLPLCGNHHQIPANNGMWVSRHGDGKKAFEKEYGTELELYELCLELLGES